MPASAGSASALAKALATTAAGITPPAMLSAIAATSLPGIGRLFDRSVPSQAAQQRAADEPARGQGRRPQPIAWQTGMSSDAWRRFWFDWRTLPPGWTAA